MCKSSDNPFKPKILLHIAHGAKPLALCLALANTPQLTDVSYVFCPSAGNIAIEQFVAAGTRCAQGIVGHKLDAFEYQPATVTRVFVQHGPDGKPADIAAKPTVTQQPKSSPSPSPREGRATYTSWNGHGPCPTINMDTCFVHDTCLSCGREGWCEEKTVCKHELCYMMGLPPDLHSQCGRCMTGSQCRRPANWEN